MSDPQYRLMHETFREWLTSETAQTAGNQPIEPNILTAEDWDAARRALGAGSRSLLFGTSTKVLDSIVDRFKKQAPTSVPPPQSDQEDDNPTSESTVVTASTKAPEAGVVSWRIEPKRFFMRGDPIGYRTVPIFLYVSSSGIGPEGESPEAFEDFFRALYKAATHIDDITEQSERPVSRQDPPSS